MRDNDGIPQRESTTNWQAHDTPSMWRMIEPQQTDAHWRHVSGLRRMAELTATHLGRLQRYRDGLAEAWPPERSKASQAFISRLDYLIEHVRGTHQVAAANYSTVSTATAAVQATRSDMEKIHAEYQAKLQALRTYENLAQTERASQLPGTTIGPPPATSADLERINLRARLAMSGLSSALVEAQTRLQRPAPYAPVGHRDDPTTIYGSRGNKPTIRAMIAAPTPPSPALDGSSGGFRATPYPAPAAPAGGPTSILPRSLTAEGLPKRSSNEVESRRSNAVGLGTSGRSTGAVAAAVVGHVTPAMPTGGIIGPPTTPGQSGARSGPIINPTGGVISAPPPNSSAGSPGAVSGHPSRRHAADNPSTQSVLQESWIMAVGVPPVIAPSTAISTHDPGPAIGIDH
ncbi:hypothetical protein Ais01nite_27390 [Asanoa ishikariensis]|uniref:Uncharacterized protein n=1 Tax=Asanoa ishikariensis TaxID=137265 RepID=A0A1H3QTG8_9ACTN|nr:hypothetical protein Ais01nite_27390 [Asanoa ishikariensis]SDZ16814.1 hypothetical protein SAMN05421684_3182 [Asanoa ishikariensis]